MRGDRQHAHTMLPSQELLKQSVPCPQLFPSTQPPQLLPPQSTSVSSWFVILSLHVGAWQAWPAQTPL